MDIWHGLAEVPSQLGKTVVTIGVFDGVHRGHRSLVEKAVKVARERGLKSVMATFDPHPMAVFLPERSPLQLESLEDRLRHASDLGIDYSLVVNFTRELGGLSPEHYFTSLLIDTLHAEVVLVGQNFTFGRDGLGNADELVELGRRHGVEVEIVGLLQGDGETLCSSLVRGALADGDIGRVNWALGRYFCVTAKIVHGVGRGGKELGYPTANQYFPESRALPADGVYAGWLTVLDDDAIKGDMEPAQRYPVAISVGTNPTFGEEPRSVESFVIDRSADLYGHTARVEFVARIRDMVKFDGLDELLEAMGNDVNQARDLLAHSDGCDVSAQ